MSEKPPQFGVEPSMRKLVSLAVVLVVVLVIVWLLPEAVWAPLRAHVPRSSWAPARP